MEVPLGGNACNDVGLDAAVVLPAEDLEGAVVAPVVVPGVGHQPVGGAALHAPAQNPKTEGEFRSNLWIHNHDIV